MKCTSCLEELPDSEFTDRKTRKGAVHKHRQCRDCVAATVRKRVSQNRAKYTERNRKYHEANREKRKARGYLDRRWKDNVEWLRALKSENPCIDCGRTFHFASMDLDHVRGEKRFSVSAVIGRAISNDAFLEEIQKCELVCSNCHRVRTWKRNNS